MNKYIKDGGIVLMLILSVIIIISCGREAIPRPEGYFRIDLPEKNYQVFDGSIRGRINLPLAFEYPAYGRLTSDTTGAHEQGWFNIDFPQYKASIYLTYKKIDNNFSDLMEQTYKMNVKNHITKADAIDEKEFANNENRVFGIMYDLKGNTASAVQFYATDSTRNYLRGSLYFAAEPNADSLAPVIDFFRNDIVHLIETLKWR